MLRDGEELRESAGEDSRLCPESGVRLAEGSESNGDETSEGRAEFKDGSASPDGEKLSAGSALAVDESSSSLGAMSEDDTGLSKSTVEVDGGMLADGSKLSGIMKPGEIFVPLEEVGIALGGRGNEESSTITEGIGLVDVAASS